MGSRAVAVKGYTPQIAHPPDLCEKNCAPYRLQNPRWGMNLLTRLYQTDYFVGGNATILATKRTCTANELWGWWSLPLALDYVHIMGVKSMKKPNLFCNYRRSDRVDFSGAKYLIIRLVAGLTACFRCFHYSELRLACACACDAQVGKGEKGR